MRCARRPPVRADMAGEASGRLPPLPRGPPSHGEAQAAGDHQPLDLRRALADLEDLGVAVVAGHEGLVHEPVTPEHLGGLPGGGHRGFGGVQLGERRLLLERTTPVLQPGSVVGEVTSGGRHHGEVGALEGHALVGADGAPEGIAVLGVLDAVVEAGLDHTHRQGRDGDAAVVEDGEEVGEAATSFAEEVVGGNPTVGEGQAVRVRRVPTHLPVGRLHLEAGGPGGDDDRADLGFARRARGIGAGGDGDQRGHLGTRVGDEGLLTVDHPLTRGLVGLSPGPGAAGVAPRLGFGEAESAQGSGCY